MDKIAVSLTDFTPQVRAVAIVSNWFETEYSTIRIDTDKDYEDVLALQLAQGFVIYAQSADTVYLKRRLAKSEDILQDMVNYHTAAYNEGRQINDQRYDDIIALLTQTLDKTEDELNALETDETALNNLIGTILDGLDDKFSTLDTDLGSRLDEWGVADRLRINNQFDAEKAAAKQRLINSQLYNQTTITDVWAGVERERALALSDLNDKILKQQVDLDIEVYRLDIDINTKLVEARARLAALLEGQGNNRLTIRNRVVEAIANFAERREDGYPDLGQLAGMAASMGNSAVSDGFK